jgi:DNA-binding NarL/FixJ family response regulator
MVVLDLYLSDGHGFTLLEGIRRMPGWVPVLLISGAASEVMLTEGIATYGADDFIRKPIAPRELVARVNARLRGIHTARRVPSCQDDNIAKSTNQDLEVLVRTRQLALSCQLTKRQADVAELLYHRRTNIEIADRLGISVHTAKRHVETVLLKLGATSRTMVERLAATHVGPMTHRDAT